MKVRFEFRFSKIIYSKQESILVFSDFGCK